MEIEISKLNSDIFSILKAIAIIAVVAGHTLYEPVSDFVYLFHLPLFYFCSGYLFKDKYADAKWEFVKNRFKRLYIPTFLYGLFFLLIYNLLFDLNVYSQYFGYLDSVSHRYVLADYISALKQLLICNPNACGAMLGAMWFVRSILICSIVFCFLVFVSKKLSPNRSDCVLGVLVFSAAILFNWVPFEWYKMPLKPDIVREMACGVPLMYFGRLFRYVKTEKIEKYYLPIGLVCFIVLIALNLVEYNNSVGAGWHQTSLLLHYVVSLIGIVFTYICATYIVNTPLTPPLKIIGKYTFEIMALHFIAFKLVSLVQIYIYNYDATYLSKFPVIEINSYIWWIPYTIVGVGLPLFYVWLKNNFQRLVNVGKR